MNAITAIIRKELADYALNPRLTFGVLIASLAILWVAGNLSVGESSYRVLVVGPEDELATAKLSLAELSNLELVAAASSLVDSREMRLEKADFAIVHRQGRWVVFHQAITAQQEAAFAGYASALAYFLNDSDDRKIVTEKVAAAITEGSVSVSRLGAFPGSSQITIVPRTIALVAILIAFIFGARSYSRDARSGILPLLFVARRVGWTSVVVAKLAASVAMATLLLLVLLEAAYLIYGISLKPGLAPQVGMQILAMVASAALGISTAMLARNESYLYILTGIYVILLVVLSGFLLPLDAAAPFVRWAAHVSPLTFAGRLLEEWSFYAIQPTDLVDSVYVAGQALVALTILGASAAFTSRRV